MKTLLAAGALALAGTTAFATCDGYSVSGDKWMMVVEVEENTHWFMGTPGYGGYDNPTFAAAAGILDTCYGVGESILFTGPPSSYHGIQDVSGSDGALIVGYLNAYTEDEVFTMD